mgnify:CR=1 FL=1
MSSTALTIFFKSVGHCCSNYITVFFWINIGHQSMGDGTVVSGTNQENAAYPSGLCAERTTLFYANSRYPDQPVITLAIAARTEKDFIDNPIPPCGACRQVILETEKRYGQPIRILLYGKECIYEIKSIGDLLPLSFDASAMED